MFIINLRDVSLNLGARNLFKKVNLAVADGERIGLIGHNGSGKSTLFDIILKKIQIDDGEIIFRSNSPISLLQQNPVIDQTVTVVDYLKQGLDTQYNLLDKFEQAASNDSIDTNLIAKLQAKIDAHDSWNLDNRIQTIVSQLNLPAAQKLSQLSGGWLRRVALGQALIQNPKLLLLDEPTNHLDIETIEWLETMLNSYQGSVIVITHDRQFLQKISNRIIEIDRGKLVNYNCGYKKFLENRAANIETEDKHNKLFDKKLNREEQWIRQGIKARRTRNEGRVRALEAMRSEFANREKRQKKGKFYIQSSQRSGRKVIEVHNLNYSITKNCKKITLITNFNLKIIRGDRIALIGANGSGKSSLLKLLMGKLKPDAGSIKLGSNTQIAYFDQIEHGLNIEKTVRDNVSDGRDYITINDKPRHIIGYLKNFLFSPEKSQTLVKSLSGGERNRVVLAKLFSRPSNFLILDEPTNDLDLETLEVLEQQLMEYAGTILIVSHDRNFIDNIATSTLSFFNDNIYHYAGAYSDLMRQQQTIIDKNNKLIKQETTKSNTKTSNTKKLSYKLQRQLDAIPNKIAKLEQQQQEITEQLQNPNFYKLSAEEKLSVTNKSRDLQRQIDILYEGWQGMEDNC